MTPQHKSHAKPRRDLIHMALEMSLWAAVVRRHGPLSQVLCLCSPPSGPVGGKRLSPRPQPDNPLASMSQRRQTALNFLPWHNSNTSIHSPQIPPAFSGAPAVHADTQAYPLGGAEPRPQ